MKHLLTVCLAASCLPGCLWFESTSEPERIEQTTDYLYVARSTATGYQFFASGKQTQGTAYGRGDLLEVVSQLSFELEETYQQGELVYRDLDDFEVLTLGRFAESISGETMETIRPIQGEMLDAFYAFLEQEGADALDDVTISDFTPLAFAMRPAIVQDNQIAMTLRRDATPYLIASGVLRFGSDAIVAESCLNFNCGHQVWDSQTLLSIYGLGEQDLRIESTSVIAAKTGTVSYMLELTYQPVSEPTLPETLSCVYERAGEIVCDAAEAFADAG